MDHVAITTCMGRLEHLKQSLPLMLEHLEMPVVVVDYCCPDGTSDWIRGSGLKGVHVVRVHPDQARTSPSGKPLFHKAHAQNIGAGKASWLGASNLTFIDADTLVKPGTGDWIRGHSAPDRFIVSLTSSERKELVGFLSVPALSFRALRGFDESIEDWGQEDLDLRLRLFLKERLHFDEMPPEQLDWIRHSDELRAANYAAKDIEQSAQRNARIMISNALRACPGATMEQIFNHPPIVRLMGCIVRIV
jgi:hypothetical protein